MINVRQPNPLTGWRILAPGPDPAHIASREAPMRFLGLLISVLAVVPAGALAQNKACALATPAELEAAVGAKPLAMSPSTLPTGTEMCKGKAGTITVTVRYFKRATDPSGEKEKAGIEAMKKMGAKVEVKKIGPATCMALGMAQGFSSSCTVAKPPFHAVIEVGSPKDAVPIERLAPVAEKMLSRF
jgi:hypothetical protein